MFGFVHRRDARGRDVALIPPEARTSVQVRRGDPYFIREIDAAAEWREVPEASLWGPRLKRGYGYAARNIEVFGVGLTPAGFRALAGASPGSFLNDAPPLQSTAPAIGVLIAALGENGDVAGAARRFGLSERHFRRLFAAEFGASPKIYARILRFDRTLRRLHPRPWEIADRPDTEEYADQAHLIREFCAFAEFTPGAYVRSKERHGDRILRSIVAEGVRPPEF